MHHHRRRLFEDSSHYIGLYLLPQTYGFQDLRYSRYTEAIEGTWYLTVVADPSRRITGFCAVPTTDEMNLLMGIFSRLCTSDMTLVMCWTTVLRCMLQMVTGISEVYPAHMIISCIAMPSAPGADGKLPKSSNTLPDLRPSKPIPACSSTQATCVNACALSAIEAIDVEVPKAFVAPDPCSPPFAQQSPCSFDPAVVLESVDDMHPVQLQRGPLALGGHGCSRTSGCVFRFCAAASHSRFLIHVRRLPLPPITIIEDLVPDLQIHSAFHIINACNSWVTATEGRKLTSTSRAPPKPSTHTVTMFTSSAVDAAGLKCVAYTHSMLLRAVQRMLTCMGGDGYIAKPKRHLGWLPLGHAFELNAGLLSNAMGTGGVYVFFDPEMSSPGDSASLPISRLLLSALAFHEPIHSFAAVPAIMASIIDELAPSELRLLQDLHSLTVGGAAGTSELFEWGRKNGIKYFDMVGMTEAAGPTCARNALEKKEGMTIMRPGLMGVLVKDQEDEDYGELVLIGTHLPTSYEFKIGKAYSYDAESGATTYRTGDLYRLGPDFTGIVLLEGEPIPPFDERLPVLSDIQFFSRIDDLVVLSSGLKVNAADVERVLDSHPEVSYSAIVGNEKSDALVALIQPKPSLTHAAIVEVVLRVNHLLPFEKKIQRHNVIVVDSLPITSKGTLHRKKLKHMIHKSGGAWPFKQAQNYTPVADNSSAPMSNSLSTIPSDVRQRMEILVADILSMPLEEIQDPSLSLLDVHISSFASIRLAKAIQDTFGCRLKRADLFGARSVDDLCRLLFPDTAHPSAPTSTHPLSPEAPSSTAVERNNSADLVITGASCRFPNGIDSLDDFWAALLSPKEYVAHVAGPPPPSRWASDPSRPFLPMAWLDDPSLDCAASFSSFFSLPLHEVVEIPPSVRLCMQMGYRALEDAGIAPKSLNGKCWGVFTSVNDSGWEERRLGELDYEEYGRTMASRSDENAAGRVAYFLNLTGPAMEIRTACSSSAVAIHQGKFPNISHGAPPSETGIRQRAWR
ncbi:hypothetical protein EVG20_g4117 [Dentipellis fragilis]|uniref:Uncharacterized protein n=1 Tax=Dentipellis fragilis TaxID=205917 RepID=A0A4Y9YXA9_9AGAM|nr:hypothetical protein EVG20_g4117 [Dentipellis fragilis]